jgi:hypothetical protein
MHKLASLTKLGRTIGINSIAVFHGAVSRAHAEIHHLDSGWVVEDVGSANGTYVNNSPIAAPCTLATGDQLTVGGVAFYFCEDVSGLRLVESSGPMATVDVIEQVPTQLAYDETTQHGFPVPGSEIDELALRLYEPGGGGGGVVQLNDRQAQLGEAQFALVNVLYDRMRNELDKPGVIRGFIRSSELLQLLPWDTPHPSDNHLKQLVRRTRRTLSSAGISGIIESRQRFGYRLRVDEEEAN